MYTELANLGSRMATSHKKERGVCGSSRFWPLRNMSTYCILEPLPDGLLLIGAARSGPIAWGKGAYSQGGDQWRGGRENVVSHLRRLHQGLVEGGCAPGIRRRTLRHAHVCNLQLQPLRSEKSLRKSLADSSPGAQAYRLRVRTRLRRKRDASGV
eukprot:2845377-Pyramimonas_sp.AAC.1